MKILYAIVMASSVTSLFAQDSYNLTKLPLTDLSSFESPSSNWQIVGAVYGKPEDARPVVENGSGVLYNNFDEKRIYKPETNLVTKLEHGDIFISLDFLMPKGSNSGIYLQGRYEIQLFDSWGVKKMKSSDVGSIYERWDEARPEGKKGFEGHAARTNASFAPNLWQHLEIEFQAPRFDASGKKTQPARFVKVSLNGIVLHENVIVHGLTRASAYQDERPTGPIVFQGDHGPVAFRNIRYALLDDFNFELKDVTYAYYEGKFNNDFKEVEKQKPSRTGKADAIDLKLADDPNNMSISFSGSFEVPKDDAYQFTLKKRGNAKLSVDGQPLIKEGSGWFRDATASVNLKKGTHTLSVAYVKNFSWAPGGLGLLVGTPNTRPVALHTNTSFPVLPPAPLIQKSVGVEPEIVRSFLMHDGRKLTHVMSVGTPSSVHYSVDLDQGALLQMWRGDFLNVTEMWYERGEPQVASPLGAYVAIPRISPLRTTQNSPLSDTLDDKHELIFKGYTLNEERMPVFQYQSASIPLELSIKPDQEGRGLVETLHWATNEKAGQFSAWIAKGTDIRALAENLYSIDGRYYVRLSAQGKSKAEIKTANGYKVLMINIDPSLTQYYYQLIW